MKKIKKYKDTLGGKNYGCYPIETPGEYFKKKFDSSELWEIIETQDHIDQRNDNQCDIHRGSDFTYIQKVSGIIVNIFKENSRSGKTVNWEFHIYSDDDLVF